jgi:hypothetical protein
VTLEQGKAYKVRLTSGAWVQAEFLSAETDGGFNTVSRTWGTSRHIRKTTRYHFRNLASGRTITLRSQRKVKEIV